MKIRPIKALSLARGRLRSVGEAGQGCWALGETDAQSAPLEPVGNLVDIMRALHPSLTSRLHYRNVEIPMLLALSAYDAFIEKEQAALNRYRSRPAEAIEIAKEAGMALGEFALRVGKAYYPDLASTVAKLEKTLVLYEAFDAAFRERLRTVSDASHP